MSGRDTGRARWRRGLVVLALGLVVSQGARAYIPSVGSLLRKAAGRAVEGKGSREATLTGWLSLGDGAPAQATLSLKFPLDCALSSSGKSASVRGNPAAPKVEDGGLGALALELLTLSCPLIAYRGQGAPEAEATLRAVALRAGVQRELKPTSFARLYDRVAVVLGALPRQLDRPQLWLYKETAAPARLLARRGEALDDLRLLEYGNPAAAEWFPRVLELWRGAQLIARFETLTITGFQDVPGTADEADDE